MTALPERISQSAFDGSRLRVVLLLDLFEGAQQRFLEAYEHMCRQVASIPGHISDQLCQSIENPSQWLITSEWESAPPFLAWVNSEEHVAAGPAAARLRAGNPVPALQRAARDGNHRRQRPRAGQASADLPPAGRRCGPARAHLHGQAGQRGRWSPRSSPEYNSPQARVDEHTRLRRTSLFMHGNRVVRAVEVEGELLVALRHVARQPEVRAVEEAINPYLEQDRDLADPESARMFFTRAALPTVHHVATGRPEPADVRRHALFYPAKRGAGDGAGPAARRT